MTKRRIVRLNIKRRFFNLPVIATAGFLSLAVGSMLILQSPTTKESGRFAALSEHLNYDAILSHLIIRTAGTPSPWCTRVFVTSGTSNTDVDDKQGCLVAALDSSAINTTVIADTNLGTEQGITTKTTSPTAAASEQDNHAEDFDNVAVVEAIDDIPAIKEIPGIQDLPTIKDILTVDKIEAIKDIPTVDDSETIDNSLAIEDRPSVAAPFIEDIATVYDSEVFDNNLSIEDTPSVAVTPFIEGIAAVDDIEQVHETEVENTEVADVDVTIENTETPASNSIEIASNEVENTTEAAELTKLVETTLPQEPVDDEIATSSIDIADEMADVIDEQQTLVDNSQTIKPGQATGADDFASDSLSSKSFATSLDADSYQYPLFGLATKPLSNSDEKIESFDVTEDEGLAKDFPGFLNFKNPRSLLVMIDAGHGGIDVGTNGPNGSLEKDLTLDIAKRLQTLASLHSDIDIVLSRSDDSGMSRQHRIDSIAEQNPDLLLSIHLNSLPQPNVTLVETYYASEADMLLGKLRANNFAKENTADAQTSGPKLDRVQRASLSRDLANFVQSTVFSTVQSHNPRAIDAGVKNDSLFVLTGNNIPAVLIEMTCLSNPEEESRLETESYRTELAESLMQAIRQFADKHHEDEKLAAEQFDKTV